MLKNQPKLTLESLLKRRKTTLKNFLNDAGVQSYSGLIELCKRLGIAPISEQDYISETGSRLVTSQEDGIVVIEPLPVEDVKRIKKNRKKDEVKEAEHQNDPEQTNNTSD